MNTAEIIIIILLAIAIILLVILIISARKKGTDNKEVKDYSEDFIKVSTKVDTVNTSVNDTRGGIITDVNNSFQKMTDSINKMMSLVRNDVNEQMKNSSDSTSKSLSEFGKQAGAMQENTKQIQEQLNRLLEFEKVLHSNQDRGAFGEIQLEQILGNTFGDDRNLYDTQFVLPYKVDNSEVRPDAVIKMPTEIICIDSKFPLVSFKAILDRETKEIPESLLKAFKSDVKTQIESIAKKYIHTPLTSEYACMFVPSDRIVSLIYDKCYDLIDLAQKRKVVILSPSTIVPFIASYKTVKINYIRNQKVKEISEALDNMRENFRLLNERWGKFNSQLDTLLKTKADVNISIGKTTKKFNEVCGLQGEEDEETN